MNARIDAPRPDFRLVSRSRYKGRLGAQREMRTAIDFSAKQDSSFSMVSDSLFVHRCRKERPFSSRLQATHPPNRQCALDPSQALVRGFLPSRRQFPAQTPSRAIRPIKPGQIPICFPHAQNPARASGPSLPLRHIETESYRLSGSVEKNSNGPIL